MLSDRNTVVTLMTEYVQTFANSLDSDEMLFRIQKTYNSLSGTDKQYVSQQFYAMVNAAITREDKASVRELTDGLITDALQGAIEGGIEGALLGTGIHTLLGTKFLGKTAWDVAKQGAKVGCGIGCAFRLFDRAATFIKKNPPEKISAANRILVPLRKLKDTLNFLPENARPLPGPEESDQGPTLRQRHQTR